MNPDLNAVIGRTRVLTFDCYGTLIDWETGLRDVFRGALGQPVGPRLADVFDAYLEMEAAVEREAYRSYRGVVATAIRRAGARLGVRVSTEHAAAVADSVGCWSPFSDTCAALIALKRRFRLGVLSNVDRDMFARTAEQFPVRFDFVVTAQDVRSYKPAHAHFARFRETLADDDSDGPGAGWVHVAQSQVHDGVPATELGIPFVWINRRGEPARDDARPMAEFPDLATFVEAVARAVPG